jgi:hypothetical protein
MREATQEEGEAKNWANNHARQNRCCRGVWCCDAANQGFRPRQPAFGVLPRTSPLATHLGPAGAEESSALLAMRSPNLWVRVRAFSPELTLYLGTSSVANITRLVGPNGAKATCGVQSATVDHAEPVESVTSE